MVELCEISFLAVFIPLVIIGLTVFLATRKKSSYLIGQKPATLYSLSAALSSSEIFKRISQKAPAQGYQIDWIDEEKNCMILKDSMRNLSWGFFYPVYVFPKGNRTVIEVGAESRFMQNDPEPPVKKDYHKKCVNFIQGLFTAHD